MWAITQGWVPCEESNVALILFLQCGVIEVVPDSKSRDQLGKQTQVSLKEYFYSAYGDEDSVTYQEVYIYTVVMCTMLCTIVTINDSNQ